MGVMSSPASDFFLTEEKYSFEARLTTKFEPLFLRSVLRRLVIFSSQNS